MASQSKPAQQTAVDLVERYGRRLPASYSNLQDEYVAAREGAAVYDRSYVGRLKAIGPDVLDLLNRLSTNRTDPLPPGEGSPTVLTTEKGRIIDLLLVLNLGGYILLITGPENGTRVAQWIDKYTFVEDITLEDVTGSTSLLSVLGPTGARVASQVFGAEVGKLQPYQSMKVEIAGTSAYLIRTDPMGQQGYDILIPAGLKDSMWSALADAGGVSIGEHAFDALRIASGMPLSGKELTEDYNPLEVGLAGCISFSKGCYIGQEVVARLDTYQKLQRHLVSLRLPSGPVARQGQALLHEGKAVGVITSLAVVPGEEGAVGMGYVRKLASEPGTRLSLEGESQATVEIVSHVQPFGPAKE